MSNATSTVARGGPTDGAPPREEESAPAGAHEAPPRAGDPLVLVAAMLPGVRAALHLRESLPLRGRAWPSGSEPSDALVAAARRAALSTSPFTAPGERLRIATPCAGGALAVELDPLPPAQHPALHDLLAWAAAWMSLDAGPPAEDPHAGTLELARLLLHERPLAAGAMALTARLARELVCDRVSLGLVRRGVPALHTISDRAVFDGRTRLARDLEAAMGEVAAAGGPLVYPPGPEETASPATAALSETHGDTAVIAVALRDGESVVGALVLERSGGTPFRPAAVARVEAAVTVVGPLLALLARDARGPLAAAAGALAQRLGPTGAGLRVRPALLAGLLAAAAVLVLVSPGTHRLTANAVVEGRVQRAVVAPYDGYVEQAYRRAGDEVRAGEPLARLQARDVEIERRALDTQREELVKQQRRALSRLDRAEIQILGDQIARVETRRELIDDRIRRADLLSPLDGVVVSGDLRRALGSPVERGQVLFEVAPLSGYELELSVDERDIEDVAVGQHGTAALSSLPGVEIGLEVSRVTPVSALQNGRNVFRAEARMLGPPAALRPGMQGVAKIEVGERTRGWVWTHRLVDYVRLWLWTWWP